MAYEKFADLDSDVQIERLQKAVKELQGHFKSHRHAVDGAVTIEAFAVDETDMDGIYNEDDE